MRQYAAAAANAAAACCVVDGVPSGHGGETSHRLSLNCHNARVLLLEGGFSAPQLATHIWSHIWWSQVQSAFLVDALLIWRRQQLLLTAS